MESGSDREAVCGKPPLASAVVGATEDRLLRLGSVCERLDCSASWLKAEVRAGRFPEPIRAGVRFTRWKESDVARYVAELTAAPDVKAATFNQLRARNASMAAENMRRTSGGKGRGGSFAVGGASFGADRQLPKGGSDGLETVMTQDGVNPRAHLQHHLEQAE